MLNTEENINLITDAAYKAQVKANEESLRDSFAHAALNALIPVVYNKISTNHMCTQAYQIADNMLEARKQ